MDSRRASGAVRFGYGLVTVLLVLAIAFGIFAIVSVIVGLARDGNSLLYGDRLTVPVQLSPEDFGSLPSEVQPRGWVNVDFVVTGPTSEQMFFRSAMDFGANVIVAAGLWLLRGFMSSVVKGDPFGSRNVRRLRGLGFLLVAGGLALELVNYSLRLVLYDNLPSVPDVTVAVAGPALPAGALLGGLIAFILAEVFAYGALLREDAEGTI